MKFPERNKLLKLIQEEIEYLNKPITRKDIEIVIFKLIYFNWRLIKILWWFLPYIDMNQTQVYMYSSILKPLLPPSPSHPSGLSQWSGFECPVSCIELGLVIYFTYGNTHVSMLFSQITPPSPSPRKSNDIIYICVSFAVLHIGSSFKGGLACCDSWGHKESDTIERLNWTELKFYIYALIYWCFSFCLTSFCVIGSSFIDLIRTDSYACFFFLIAPLCICTTTFLSIHLLMDI